MDAALAHLADACGIELQYADIWGNRHDVPETTVRALLAAMHVEVAADARVATDDLLRREWQGWLPPVTVVRADAGPVVVALTVAATRLGQPLRWTLSTEDDRTWSGTVVPGELPRLGEQVIDGVTRSRRALELPVSPGPGYHGLDIEDPAGDVGAGCHMRLVVAPARGYEPEALADGGRVWGLATQLYALRSRRNWGIGDFTDLKTVVEFAADAGAAVVGVNPLHALFPEDPSRCSPYSPSSRLFLNPLYIDVTRVPEIRDEPAGRALLADAEFQDALARARAGELVNYEAVAAVKKRALALGWQRFRDEHLGQGTERARAFERFREAGGVSLQRFATFTALQATLHARDRACWGWPAWPEDHRDPDGPVIGEFVQRHGEEIRYQEWLQWLADAQLAEAGQASYARGLGIGIYQDMALGVNPGGAETWMWRDAFATGAHAGAPPDDFNLAGQDWGLPPFVPHRLREAAYEPFVAILRANMRHAGALRLDHVMALMRLFWVPAGGGPAQGAYVRYPLDDMLGILALESVRNRCLVIGEDLGTVPEALRPKLREAGLLSYRPMQFERREDGGFAPPAAYPGQALVCLGTHDLPTLRGFWSGHDIDTRGRLGLYPSADAQERAVVARAEDRARLLLALQREDLLPGNCPVHPVAVPEVTAPLSVAVHVFLARTPASVMMVQPEDVFLVEEQTNLPGSSERQYPNWQHRLPVDLEGWADDARLQAFRDALATERGARAEAMSQAAGGVPREPVIPRATYRLQFNRDFTLRAATAIVPYLDALGVSHVYASPLLKARPGSRHGYDIVDHNALNPEIGSDEDLGEFVATLKSRGMGVILDIVPNHMGVMGADNAWWLDVLEHGQASVFAPYFDIDWQPLNPELLDKVLVPLLGDHYGTVLHRGELKLVFDTAGGEFSVFYWEHRLPVDPAQYPVIAGHRIDRLAAALGAEEGDFAELQGLLSAFGNLPPHRSADAEARDERARNAGVYKRQLAGLCARQPAIARHLADVVAEYNGWPGDAASFDLLHALIKRQAWRLASWRVASDDINYRRFFDVNDLAALRMEDPDVFDATHRLVLDLVARGDVDGLRVDHPDGLYDPVRYFERLQMRAGGPDRSVGPLPGPLSLYVVVEKILAEHEHLPEDWSVHGETGYRFSNLVHQLFVDAQAEGRFTRICAQFTGERRDFDAIAYEAKKIILNTSLASELNVLANRLWRIAMASRETCDYTLNGLRDALAEVVACFPVYRGYLADDRSRPEDRRNVEWAVAVARRRAGPADVSIHDFLGAVLTTEIAAGRSRSYRDIVVSFAMRAQQYTAPVMAKGVEDTAFYRYHRLVSLNDVGADPRRFGMSVAGFHQASRVRAGAWPHGMLATSTHDSKRSEDVRARLDVLSEIPAAWKLLLRRFARSNRSRKRLVDEAPAPSRNDEYLFYQTVIGTWPTGTVDATALADYRARIDRYMIKAAREAKVHTSWLSVNEDYEKALSAFVAAVLTPGRRNAFPDDLATAVRTISHCGFLNGLSLALLKFTSPGVPDLYQGNELWRFDLVDPDNRRRVDHAVRRTLLEEIAARFSGPPTAWRDTLRALVEAPEDGRIKLYLTWRVLSLRRQWPEVLGDGVYEALVTEGDAADHLVAFVRRREGRAVVVVVPRLVARLAGEPVDLRDVSRLWGDTSVRLPESVGAVQWTDVLGGNSALEGPATELPARELFRNFPVALLAGSVR